MGCNNSTNNAVQPLKPEEVTGDEVGSGSRNPPLSINVELTLAKTVERSFKQALV